MSTINSCIDCSQCELEVEVTYHVEYDALLCYPCLWEREAIEERYTQTEILPQIAPVCKIVPESATPEQTLQLGEVFSTQSLDELWHDVAQQVSSDALERGAENLDYWTKNQYQENVMDTMPLCHIQLETQTRIIRYEIAVDDDDDDNCTVEMAHEHLRDRYIDGETDDHVHMGGYHRIGHVPKWPPVILVACVVHWAQFDDLIGDSEYLEILRR